MDTYTKHIRDFSKRNNAFKDVVVCIPKSDLLGVSNIKRCDPDPIKMYDFKKVLFENTFKSIVHSGESSIFSLKT